MTKTGEAARPTPEVDAESITDWLITHQRSVIIGAIVIAAGVGGGWLWKRSAEIKEGRAEEAYLSAEAAFIAGNVPLAQAELEKITVRWAGTSAGTQAAMLMAQLLYDQGKYAEGIAQLDGLTSKAPKLLRAGVQALIAGGHEGAGQPAEAATAFALAAQSAQFTLDRQMYRMEQARNLVAAGDVAGARAIYSEIRVLDDSPHAGEAKVRLGELIAKQ